MVYIVQNLGQALTLSVSPRRLFLDIGGYFVDYCRARYCYDGFRARTAPSCPSSHVMGLDIFTESPHLDQFADVKPNLDGSSGPLCN